jgi:hypothetical protein
MLDIPASAFCLFGCDQTVDVESALLGVLQAGLSE